MTNMVVFVMDILHGLPPGRLDGGSGGGDPQEKGGYILHVSVDPFVIMPDNIAAHVGTNVNYSTRKK